jgi:hypothetical protein
LILRTDVSGEEVLGNIDPEDRKDVGENNALEPEIYRSSNKNSVSTSQKALLLVT